MELTALPGQVREDSAACGPQPGVIIARDQLRHLEPALAKPLEERAPVHLGLRERNRDAEQRALAVLFADAHRYQHRAVDHRPAVPDLLVAGVEDQVRAAPGRPLAPGRERGI